MYQKGRFKLNLVKNIGILRRYHSEQLASFLAQLKIPPNYELVRHENQKLINVAIDKKLMFPNDIDTETEKLIKTLNPLNKWKISLGIGLGHHLKLMLEHHRDQIQKILIFERDYVMLKLAFMMYDFSKLLSQPHLVKFILGDIKEPGIFAHRFFAENSEMIHYIDSGEYLTIDLRDKETKQYYYKIARELQAGGNNKLKTFGNDPEDSMIGLVNIINNAKHTLNSPGIIDLENRFRGKSAILVAGGPSLQYEMENLKRLKGKIFIGCVDTALKPLLKNGIKPDLVTTLERGEQIVNYYNDLEEFDLTDIVFCPLSLVDKILFEQCTEKYKMPTIVGYRTISQYELMPVDKGKIFCGQSSALLLFNIYRLWGFSDIILVGQDLAFGEDDKTHVDGAEHSINGMQNSNKIKQELFVDGNYQEKVKTLGVWDSFRRFYEADIVEYQEKQGGIVYNAAKSKTSARIEGTTMIDLDECVSDEEFNLLPIYESVKLPDNEYEKHYDKFINILKESSDYIRNAMIEIKKIANDERKSLKEIEKSSSKIINHPFSYALVSHIAQSKYLLLQIQRKAGPEQEEDIRKFYKDMAEVYCKYAQWPLDLIDDYRHEIYQNLENR